MNREDVIFVEKDGVAKIKAMKARFNQLVVDDASEDSFFA